METRAEKWALCCAGLMVLAGSWLEGGRADGSYWLMGGIGWVALIGVALMSWRDGTLQISRTGRWLLGAWALLAGLVITSILNATHEWVTLPTGARILIPIDHRDWLPMTVEAGRTLRFSFLYGGIGALCVSLALARPERASWRKLLGLLVVNAVALGLVGLYFELKGSTQMLGMLEARNPKFFSTFHYHNHWGAFAALGLAASAALARAAQRRGELGGLRWVALIGAVLILTITGVIGGGRASGALVVVLALLFVGAAVAKSVGPRRTRFLDGVAAAVLVIGASGIAVAFMGSEQLAERVEKTQEQIAELRKGEINDIRLYAAPRDTLRMIKDRPVLGWGLGSFLHIFPLYAGEEFYSPHYKEMRRMDYAHNDYLQFLAELGAVGFILLVAPPLILLWRRPKSRSAIAFWCLAGCGAILTLSLIEFPFGNPAVMAFFAVLAAGGLRYASNGAAPGKESQMRPCGSIAACERRGADIAKMQEKEDASAAANPACAKEMEICKQKLPGSDENWSQSCSREGATSTALNASRIIPMTRIPFKTLASAIAAASIFTTSSHAVEQTALRAYWSFDQVGEAVAIDESGNGNDVQLEPGAQMVAHNAVHGGALEIWESEGVAHFSTHDLDALTVSAHFFLDSLSPINPQDPTEVVAPRIIEAPGFAIFVSASGPSLVFEYRYDDFLESKWRLQLPGNILGRWWHFAVSFNKYQPATPPVFYIDGVKQTQVTMVEMTAGQPISNEGTAYIGNREDLQRTLDGYIDDLRIYGALLTDAEIAQLGTDCASGFFEAFPRAAPLGNLYYTVWMGFVQPEYYPWLYHYEHGWLYPAGLNGGSGWFYNNGLGWIFTTSADANMFYTVDHGWLYYSAGSMNPRLFYSYALGDWVSIQ